MLASESACLKQAVDFVAEEDWRPTGRESYSSDSEDGVAVLMNLLTGGGAKKT